MAITLTPVHTGTNEYTVDVASDGTDLSSGNIVHGLTGVPESVELTLLTADVASIPSWAATTIDGTNVIVTRDTTGAAASTVRVTIKTPHSIGR